MYFNEFESYTRAQEGAKTFVIEVERVNGTKLVSSAFPAEVYSQAVADIAAVEELKTMFVLWDRSCDRNGAIKFIPYEQIQTISILFGPPE